MQYRTTSSAGDKYDYIVDGLNVSIYVNEKPWGSPQGGRFIRALLNDIEKLKEKIESLEEDAELLSCLEAAGVDNWGGYSDAVRMYEEGEDN